MPLNNGDVFAGYTIVRRLGSGGMGEVYLAQHPRLPRRDALKVLPAELTADSEYRQRFSREADMAAELWHPHIVGIHDRGEFEGQLWLSMDYVEGTDAAELLRSQYPSSGTAEGAGIRDRQPPSPMHWITRITRIAAPRRQAREHPADRCRPAGATDHCWPTSVLPDRSATSAV